MAGRIDLPPGPRLPRLVQTLWSVRWPGSMQHHCQRRFGDCFTTRFVAPLGTTVQIAHPALVKTVFKGDPEVFRAGESNAILEPCWVGTRSCCWTASPTCGPGA